MHHRNTLVCDGVEEARELAFGRGERHKVVSKDGTLFNKVVESHILLWCMNACLASVL